MFRQLLAVCLFFNTAWFAHTASAGAINPSSLTPAQTESARNMGMPFSLPLGLTRNLPANAPNAANQAQGNATPLPPVIPAPQTADHQANDKSNVFGANLFTGAFIRDGSARFNPDYLIQIGDTISVRLWGAYAFDSLIQVDNKGNIFIPEFGPVKVQGTRNQDIQKAVESAVRTVYRNNVSVYASLAAAQPVRIYVGGNVNRPGLYDGTSLDSVLNFIDRAGGIDTERGSFLNIQIKRNETVRATVNLYDFLLKGLMPQVQLTDGDVIFVTPRQQTVTVSGLAENAKRFEFDNATIDMPEVVAMAKPMASATHVRVVRNTGTTLNVEYFALNESANVNVQNGDELEFTADKRPGTITVRIEGEHQGFHEYVLPYGAKFADISKHIQLLPSADIFNIQLFRKSVKERQKRMLEVALKNLEASVLNARSSTNEESRLRKDEAELMLLWAEKAKQIEPSGQVIIAQAENRDNLLLENGDIIRIPKQDGLVLVSGEVNFPNTILYESKLAVNDYVNKSGGYTQSADTSKIIIAHRDGSYQQLGNTGWLSGATKQDAVKQGDEILVLPKVQTKNIEVTRAISQIMFQIAVVARVIFGNNF
jgi:protein involved in polysaccharide export with SLBB domain